MQPTLKLLAIVLLAPAVFYAANLRSGTADQASQTETAVSGFPSIQEALNARPGQMLFLPAGDYRISRKIRIHTNGSGLYGPGRIIQQNANEPILEIENVQGAEIRDLTLTRPDGAMDTSNEGILAIKCRDLVIDNVRVIDNRTRAAAISLRECSAARVSRCLIRNYMRVTVEDRTGSPEWGYAFNCTDGSGISVTYSTGTLLEGNRVVEDHLRPTPEIKARYKLGDWVKRNPVKGRLMNQKAWDLGYTDNWQQGSGIVVSSPEVTDLTRILGNHIENAAQGIDLHCDHVIVANNIVVNSFMGMKAMHGSRNVLITGNQFVKNSLWAIGLMPGVASHADNTDGGSIIANNIISDFGLGDAKWIWGDGRSPFKFEHGQEPTDPPLSDVIVQGNVVQALGQPHYRYVVIIEGEPNAPRGLHFSNNLFRPGTDGLANIALQP